MHDKSHLESLWDGIFPGNDVILTEPLKYCSLIGYCHGGRQIMGSFVWKTRRVFCVDIAFFNGRKALVFTLIFYVWISNKRWFAVIADDRCNDERRLVRWVLCASTQNEELHETLLRLHFKTLFRWKVQNRESLYADFLLHSLLSFVVSPCNFLLILHLLCVPGRIATYKNSFWMQRGYVLASKQSHASVICYLLVAFAWVHFVTNFHVCFSQNGNFERVQNFLARTSRNAVRDIDYNLAVNVERKTNYF